MSATDKSVLMVIAPDKFRDEELNVTRDVLAKAGMEITVASTRTGGCKGMLGHVEPVTHTLEDAGAENYGALVLAGGAGAPEYLWDNARLHEIAVRHYNLGKVVAAICLSGVALARAGILKGKEATVYKSPESVKAYRDSGVIYKDQEVTLSGKIITANGPAASRRFGLAIADALRQAAG